MGRRDYLAQQGPLERIEKKLGLQPPAEGEHMPSQEALDEPRQQAAKIRYGTGRIMGVRD